MFGEIVDVYVFCDINQLKIISQADLGYITGFHVCYLRNLLFYFEDSIMIVSFCTIGAAHRILV